MNLRRVRLFIDLHSKNLGLIILAFLLIVFVAFNSIRVITKNKSRNNMFYTQTMNYVLPLVKVTSFDEADMAESEFSVRDAILESIGINIKNPLKVMAREVSYFGSLTLDNNEENDTKVGFNLNPFRLDDSMISKQNTKGLPLKDPDIDETDSKKPEEDDSLPNRVVNIYDPKLKTNSNASKPQVLIYHTHTTESYKPYGPDNDEATKNICAVGDELTNELLKNYGITAIHDKTVHSSPSYVKAYSRSGETVDKYLKQYGDFKLIIDMHRDSGTSKSSVTTKMNGKNVAKIMFVMSKGNPRFKQNQAVVDKLLDISESLFPNYDRGVFYYNNKNSHFNAEKSNNAVLIEVGSEINTFDEAIESAKYMGRIIGEYINGKK